MTRSLAIAALLLAAVPALAQDAATYNKGLQAYNSGDYETAAQLLFEVSNSATDQDVKANAEYYLAASFQRLNLPVTAYSYYANILKQGKANKNYLKAVEGLVNVQETLGDQYLIPNLLNNNYNEDWATLNLEVLSRINYLIGGISQRKSKFDEAKAFLEAVPKESAVYAKSQYLLGIVLVDPRYPGGSQGQEAIAAFQRVIDTTARNQKDLLLTQQLALLGLGRTYYGMGEYQKAVDAYERVPRFSKYWDQALFENGFARFQNDDLGGALGSLQALHAPQFAGAFQPESWILKATTYYFSCLHQESKTALAAFDELYLPMIEKLKGLVEGDDKDVTAYFRLVEGDDGTKVPKPVLNWVRSNERLLGVFAMLKQIDAEKRVIDDKQGWRAVKLVPEVVGYLDQTRGLLEQVAGQFAKNRLVEALRNVKGFADQAEIIRFETSKSEKELAEAGVDQVALLKKQTLYRPKTPQENWNYWKFQGEFWRDEIGYYQYTLKKGCPAGRGD
ncbi:MAG: tetratricopeptide repeat protein [Myxococcaceae bacterium]|nr:tetratricopeptide repeat protein [Myxococcaceae bacterium]